MWRLRKNKMKKIIRIATCGAKHILLLLIFSLAIQHSFAQGGQKPEEKGDASFPSGEQFKKTNITYQLIPTANNTWCYNILKEGRVYIHQLSTPGLPGNEGFKTTTQASKVAELVISKMKKGEMPPSVTIEEMKKLGAL